MLLAYLRLVHNPSDTVAMDRIINEPTRGIGPKTYDSLKSWAGEIGIGEYAALQMLHHGAAEAVRRCIWPTSLPQAAYERAAPGQARRKCLVDFAAMFENVGREQSQWRLCQRSPNCWTQSCSESGYEDSLRDGTEEGEERFANLQELRGVAAQYDRFAGHSAPAYRTRIR